MLAHASAAPPAVAGDRDSSIDELDRAIVTLAARLNGVTHDFLILVRRFDERAGWLGWGFESCADWLHWRCDLSLSAAREKVRVAHALKVLPAIAMAFARGELSYSKVRALTRVARLENEDALLEFALRTTAARVEERCRELRCGTVDSTDEAMRAHARRTLSLRRDPERGTITITVELPLETGELVDKALDRAVEATASSTRSLRRKAGRRSGRMQWSRWRRRTSAGAVRAKLRLERRITTRSSCTWTSRPSAEVRGGPVCRSNRYGASAAMRSAPSWSRMSTASR